MSPTIVVRGMQFLFSFLSFFVVMVINQITQKKLSKILKTEDRSPYWKLTSEITTALLGGPKYTLYMNNSAQHIYKLASV